jgi:predicted nucleotidyltransferase
MKLTDVEAILRALNDANVRYLIVGGLAVAAHGYVRATFDVDIVLNLERENVLKAMRALTAIGYQPLVPVDPTDFADEKKRKTWREEKNMIVFQMRHSRPESTRLDIFVEEPFQFDDELARARWDDVGGTKSPLLHVEALIELKKKAGRPQDLVDVEQLEKLIKSRKK